MRLFKPRKRKKCCYVSSYISLKLSMFVGKYIKSGLNRKYKSYKFCLFHDHVYLSKEQGAFHEKYSYKNNSNSMSILP